MDLTPVFATQLKAHGSTSPGGQQFSIERINDFLREAYQINLRARELLSYLRSIRQPYLSTAPVPLRRRRQQPGQLSSAAGHDQEETLHLNDVQRDQIDAEAKAVLRDLNAAVSNLARAEQVRQETEAIVAQKKQRGMSGALGALGKWAAGGELMSKSLEEQLKESKANVIKVHREGVIWFLQRQLQRCGEAQTSMMEIRLKRQTERSESALYESKAGGPVPVWEADMAGGDDGYYKNNKGGAKANTAAAAAAAATTSSIEELDSDSKNGLLDDEQLQMFARENQDLLKHYEQRVDQVMTAERSLIEISELQSTLAANLELQSSHIDQLIEDSFLTTENVGTGNKELKKASERKSTAKMVFYSTIGLCSTLIIWDLIF